MSCRVSAGRDCAPAVLALAALVLPVLASAQARAPVMGRVVDQDGEPVAGAAVRFEGRRGYGATTDASGEYGLLLPAGRYRIEVSHEGYRGAEFEYEIRSGDPNHLPTVDLASHASLVAAETAALESRLVEAGEAAEAGRLDEAQAMLERLREERPELPEAHYNLGVILARKQEWGAAEQALGAALELAPDHAPALLMLANVQQSSGDAEGAARTLERLVAAHPDDAAAQLSLAYLLLNEGRNDDARPVLERVAALEPGNAEAPYLLATIATGQGDYTAAVGHLERYLELAPEGDARRGAAEELLASLRPYLEQER